MHDTRIGTAVINHAVGAGRLLANVACAAACIVGIMDNPIDQGMRQKNVARPAAVGVDEDRP